MRTEDCPFGFATCPGCAQRARPGLPLDAATIERHRALFFQAIGGPNNLQRSPPQVESNSPPGARRNATTYPNDGDEAADTLPAIFRTPHNELECLSLPALASSSYRVHFRSVFCDLFFPAGRPQSHSLFQDVDPPRFAQGLTLNAGDALCTLQIAMSASDPRLLRESVKLHSIALRKMQYVLEKTPRGGLEEGLIGAVYYLMKWESLISPSWASSAWQHHADALLKMLMRAARTASAQSTGPPRFLNYMFCYALGRGLLSRKAVRLSPLIRQRLPPLILACLHIPSCLEALDFTLLDTNATQQDFRKTIKSALAARALLLRQLRFASSSAAIEHPYAEVSTAHFPEFAVLIGDELDSLYPTAYLFANLDAAIGSKTAWTSLLVLDQALLLARQHKWYHFPSSELRDIEGLESEAAQCVDDICRSFAYLSSAEARTSGALCIMEPLHFTKTYFEERKQTQHVDWCQKVEDGLLIGTNAARMLAMA